MSNELSEATDPSCRTTPALVSGPWLRSAAGGRADHEHGPRDLAAGDQPPDASGLAFRRAPPVVVAVASFQPGVARLGPCLPQRGGGGEVREGRAVLHDQTGVVEQRRQAVRGGEVVALRRLVHL